MPNLLIAALPAKDRERFEADCERVELVFADVLSQPGVRMSHVYFPAGGIISLGMVQDEGSRLELGLVGSEGMFGLPLVLGVGVSALHATVQGPGPALRMAAAAFQAQLRQSAALQKNLKRYLLVVMGQLAQAALCTRFHVVEARLARWLLMTQDRSQCEEFHVTQEFLAYVLGVRRVGVTKAAGSLQDHGLIRYHRGDMAILNRAGLEGAACACYATDSASYAQMMR